MMGFTFVRFLVKHFDARCCHMGTAIKHPVPDRVKLSFVIFVKVQLFNNCLKGNL